MKLTTMGVPAEYIHRVDKEAVKRVFPYGKVSPFISRTVFIRKFWKVNSPAKSST